MDQLGVNKQTVAWLITHGWLKETSAKGNLKPISKSSFDNFNARWLKVGEIASQVGSSRMLVKRALVRAGVSSIAAEEKSGISTFFDAEEVRGIDLAQLLNEVALYRGKPSPSTTRGCVLENPPRRLRQSDSID